MGAFYLLGMLKKDVEDAVDDEETQHVSASVASIMDAVVQNLWVSLPCYYCDGVVDGDEDNASVADDVKD